MYPNLQAPDPPLTDGVVTLRPPDLARDGPTLETIRTDPAIMAHLMGGEPAPADPAATIAGQLARWERGSDAMFSIDAAGHDLRVGFVRVLFGLYDPFRFAEVGYLLLPEGRGRGYVTRTVKLIAGWVFDELGVVRLQARTAEDNVASQRVLERAGFRREGIARSGFVFPVDKRRIDTIMWSLLPGDAR